MLAIIGAMDQEIQLILGKMEDVRVTKLADKTFYEGTIFNQKTIVAKSGVGKVNAAITTTLLLTRWKVDKVVNIGVAGGVAGCQIGDIVLADGIVYSDVTIADIDNVPFGQMGSDPLIVKCDPLMLAQARKVLDGLDENHVSGIIASGDRFVVDKKYLEEISEVVSGIVACEMEGMAVAMTCYKFDVPFLSIRGISDMLGEDDQQEKYKVSVEEIAAKTGGFALAFLKYAE